MPLSAAEKKRRYRQRRDADPERREAYLGKERAKWRKDRDTGKKRSVSELNDRERRAKRRNWRAAQVKSRTAKAASTAIISKLVSGQIVKKYRMQKYGQSAISLPRRRWKTLDGNALSFSHKEKRRIPTHIKLSIRAFYGRDDVSQVTTGRKQTITRKSKKTEEISCWYTVKPSQKVSVRKCKQSFVLHSLLQTSSLLGCTSNHSRQRYLHVQNPWEPRLCGWQVEATKFASQLKPWEANRGGILQHQQ